MVDPESLGKTKWYVFSTKLYKRYDLIHGKSSQMRTADL